MPRWTAFFLVLALLAACSTDSGPPPTNPPTNPPTQQPDITGNNSAVLTGAPLGSGETDVERLRKEVPVNLATPNPDFELGTFSATRQSVDTEDALLDSTLLPTRAYPDALFCQGCQPFLSGMTEQIVRSSLRIRGSLCRW